MFSVVSHVAVIYAQRWIRVHRNGIKLSGIYLITTEFQLEIQAVSRLLDESSAGNSSREGLEPGAFSLSNSNFRHLLKDRMQSGQLHLGSLVRQLDSLFSTGAVFLRRNSTARIWAVVYLACLHLWVIYILMSHSPASDDTRSGAVVSLENINNTATGGAV